MINIKREHTPNAREKEIEGKTADELISLIADLSYELGMKYKLPDRDFFVVRYKKLREKAKAELLGRIP